jgi:hypothetical protein
MGKQEFEFADARLFVHLCLEDAGGAEHLGPFTLEGGEVHGDGGTLLLEAGVERKLDGLGGQLIAS